MEKGSDNDHLLHFINENGQETKDLKTSLKRFIAFIRLNKPKTKVGDGIL